MNKDKVNKGFDIICFNCGSGDVKIVPCDNLNEIKPSVIISCNLCENSVTKLYD